MEAVDASIPDPVRDLDQPFLMPIEDVFTIQGRGTVVTGKVDRGKLSINSEVEIVGIRKPQKTTVTGIEMFHKQMDEAWAGENCGLLLRGTKREDVERGQVVVKPGSITPHTQFEAQRSEEHTSELQSRGHLVCRLLLEKKEALQELRQ